MQMKTFTVILKQNPTSARMRLHALRKICPFIGVRVMFVNIAKTQRIYAYFAIEPYRAEPVL